MSGFSLIRSLVLILLIQYMAHYCVSKVIENIRSSSVIIILIVLPMTRNMQLLNQQ